MTLKFPVFVFCGGTLEFMSGFNIKMIMEGIICLPIFKLRDYKKGDYGPGIEVGEGVVYG